MRLVNMLEGISYRVVQGTADIEVSGVTEDTGAVSRGMVFCCIRGQQVDGHDLSGEAVKNGARVLVTERSLGGVIPYHVTIIQVADTRAVTGRLAAAYYGWPSGKMTIIGVTGTKGKTTLSHMLWQLLQHSGVKCGLIGTNGACCDNSCQPLFFTTPTASVLQRLLYEMEKAGCEAVVMEVSSIGMKEKRCAGIRFAYGIFTNFAADHIGGREHADMEEYFYWKSRLFEQCDCGILNLDEPKSFTLYQKNAAAHRRVQTWIGYGVGELSQKNGWSERMLSAEYYAENLLPYETEEQLGMSFTLKEREADIPVHLSMPGAYNVANALGAIACAKEYLRSRGRTLNLDCLESIQIAGRTEVVCAYNGAKILVDYAHNATGLEHVLTALKTYGKGRIICVFGCGGGRSKLRRKQMGEVSDRLADEIILTEDNSRDEDVRKIIKDILSGIRNREHCQVIPDRSRAIGRAMELARPGDLVIIAGKGHESYQESHGVRVSFSDREAVRQWTKALNRDILDT